jgi:hypothetical protein
MSLGLPLLSSTPSTASVHQQQQQQQMHLQQQQFLNQLKMNAMFNMDPQTAALMNAIAASYPPLSSMTNNSLQGILSILV